jgi:adenylate cyclase
MRLRTSASSRAAILDTPIGRGRSSLPTLERRWGAVLAVDVVEYSRLTILNAELAYYLYKSHRHELLDPKLREYRARFFKSTGDGILAEFETAIDAARCAIDVQKGMIRRCRSAAKDSQIVFRMGLSCGPILADAEDIYGHDVNVAARLQAIAPAGGIAMTDEIAIHVGSVLALQLEDIGAQYFHNMACPVHVFQCRFDDAIVNRRKNRKQPAEVQQLPSLKRDLVAPGRRSAAPVTP